MASDAYDDRVSDRWGHFAPELLITAIGAVIVMGMVPVYSVYSAGISVLLFGFVIISWVLLRRHDRALCEHCLLSMPLNPSEQAARYGRRFWMSHTGSDPKFMIPYIVVLIGSNFFPGTAGRLAWAVIQSSMIFLILSYSTHRRLQPWCPWCSDGGGGMDREEPSVPDPLPDNRQLV
jgi:hypothetical protein